jgi:hypothetical protein
MLSSHKLNIAMKFSCFRSKAKGLGVVDYLTLQQNFVISDLKQKATA